MTTRDYTDAYEDDSENVRAWPAQDAQEPDALEDVAYLRAEVAALKEERAHTMSWYKTVCELLTEHTAERDDAQVEIVRLQNELHGVLCDRATAWAIIVRVRVLIDPETAMAAGSIGSDRYFCESDIRAALSGVS